MKYQDLRPSRKDVLKIVREHTNASQLYAYSEPRADHQRVKWYGCSTPVEKIKAVLVAFGYDDVVVEHHIGNGYYKGVESVVLRFPYSEYK